MGVKKIPENEGLLYLVVLDNGSYVRKMRWDGLWHLVHDDPSVPFLSAAYRRISAQKARALIRHHGVV